MFRLFRTIIAIGVMLFVACGLWIFLLDHTWSLRFADDRKELRLLGRIGSYPSGGLLIDDGTSTVPLVWRDPTTAPAPGSVAFVIGKWDEPSRSVIGKRRFSIWPGDHEKREGDPWREITHP